MTIRTTAVFTALLSLTLDVAAAQAPRDKGGLWPLYPYMTNAAWTMEDAVKAGTPEGRLAPRDTPLVVDLAKGTSKGACSFESAWTGQATYLNSDVGTLQYWGMGRGCHPTGLGTIQFADGSTYFGFVETFVRNNEVEGTDVALRREDVRVAMRSGAGQFTDASTGRIQVGRWQDDRLAVDLAGDATFIGLLQKALASVTDRGAPQYNATILDWYNYETEAERTQRLAEEQQRKTAAPPVAAVPAHLQRAEVNAAAAKDPTRIPQPILDAHPDLAKILPALQRFGSAEVAGAPFVDENLFGMVSCKQKNTEDARWTDKKSGTAYLGGHKGCFPKDDGKFRIASGLEWTGRVSNRIMLPHPNGLGVLRTENGTRVFMRVRYEEVGGTRQIFGYALADGRVIVIPDAKVESISFQDHAANLTQLASRAAQVRRYEMQYPNGAIVSATYEPTSGRFESRGYNDRSPDVFRIPELGVTIRGENVGTPALAAQQAREAQAKGTTVKRDVSQEGLWSGFVSVALDREHQALPPGRYIREVSTFSDIAMRDGLNIVGAQGAYLIPRDAKTIAALGPDTGRCKQKFPKDELPAGWVAWWPACFSDGARAFSPDGAYYLSFSLGADGKVTKRRLVQSYLMADSSAHLTWEADRFVMRNGRVVPDGVAVFDARWGRTLVEWLESSAREFQSGSDDAGLTFSHYFGPMDGLSPNGLGRCRPPNAKAGQTEACEFRNGRRVDVAYQQRVQQHQQQLAQQRAEQRRYEQREAAKRRAEQEEADRLAAQEAQQREMERRQRELEDEEDAAAYAAYQARDAARRQAENAKFAAEMQGYQKSYNDAVANAKAMQAQQAEQDRRNREEAARQERDRQAGERAYAESQARNAQAKAQAEAAYQQQRQIDQARAQAAANDAARRAAGAYGTPSNAGSSGSSSGYTASSTTPSGGSALPKPDNSKIERCSKLSRDIMSAGSDFHCNMNGKEFPTLGARRDAENACYADVAAKVAPLKAQYKDECSSTAEGGVTRY